MSEQIIYLNNRIAEFKSKAQPGINPWSFEISYPEGVHVRLTETDIETGKLKSVLSASSGSGTSLMMTEIHSTKDTNGDAIRLDALSVFTMKAPFNEADDEHGYLLRYQTNRDGDPRVAQLHEVTSLHMPTGSQEDIEDKEALLRQFNKAGILLPFRADWNSTLMMYVTGNVFLRGQEYPNIPIGYTGNNPLIFHHDR